jgi:mRNA-degrading endonuclease RelE of RelBE toxin-antitoxin system
MQVVLSDKVKTVLATLGGEDQVKIRAWFGYLQNWEQDAYARSESVKLSVQGQTVYMFRAGSELRLFYTVDQPGNTITVVDVATKDTILSSGTVPAGGS